ncbi:MAG: hypothetical protein HY053_02200 [Proteobacteria bacterium]|nr:hypothetical protein [Pseudomonadota bacterium]
MLSPLSSITLWTRCGEGASNARLEEPLKSFLRAALFEPRLHGKLLNMLSLLEHIGSRKIMLSQMRKVLDTELLKHMAEETRHAFFFKHQAERFCGQPCADYEETHTLCAPQARIYFARLDAGITRLLGKNAAPRAPYLWVSFIVELRAGWFYSFYEQALQEAKIPLSLKSIMAEEEKHLQEMQRHLHELGVMNDLLCARVVTLETKLFTRLLTHLTQAAGARPPLEQPLHSRAG